MKDPDPLFEDWKERARQADILDVARRLGVSLKKSGSDHVGACPVCGGKDKNEFVCTPAKAEPGKRWLCRKSGQGGDAIAMHMHVTGSDFMGAVEEITGEPPPRGESGRKSDPAAIAERRQEREEDARRREAEDRKADEKKMLRAADVWDLGKPIRNTGGETYFRQRGIVLTSEECLDLRFVAALEYHGYADGATDELSKLATAPAVIAAVRDSAGNLIAVHRTYLDAKTWEKFRPPGCQRRNKAKKIVGKAGGGYIRLGYIGPVVAMGEGIETTLSFARLEGAPADISLVAGYSLGNMAGSATGSVPHPKIKDRTIPNGEPDIEAPGLILPPEVEEVILLGDGDSDPEFTRAQLLVASRRIEAQGRKAFICFAPNGMDFNNLLLDQIVGRG